MDRQNKDIHSRYHLAPGAGLPLEASDNLYIALYNSVSSLVVRIAGYYVDGQGEITPFERDYTPTSDRALTAFVLQLGKCFLLSCTASIASGNANRGQCYARVRVQRASGTPATIYATVLAGYVTDDFQPSFPQGKLEGPTEGPGMIRSVTGSNPAAGAEVQETVPTGAIWRLHALAATLVNAAAAATRAPQLTLDDGTTVYARIPASGTSIISETVVWTWSNVGAGSTIASVAVSSPLPGELRMPAGHRINTLTNAINVADDWGAPQLLVEEWLQA